MNQLSLPPISPQELLLARREIQFRAELARHEEEELAYAREEEEEREADREFEALMRRLADEVDEAMDRREEEEEEDEEEEEEGEEHGHGHGGRWSESRYTQIF